MRAGDGRYLGLISGTSADAIDAALLQFDGDSIRVIAAHATPYPDSLRAAVLALATRDASASLEDLGRLDTAIGSAFADAAVALLESHDIARGSITAIGSHGQTLRHGADSSPPFTLQIGDPNTIAERTGITTVADFRRRDVAAGGQGAPLVPAFHAAVFAAPGEARAILNLGGIANLTLLPGDGGAVLGFDTGTANCLMDAWSQRELGLARDERGERAAGGDVLPDLLARLLDDPYFARRPPKSSGREYFNLQWLQSRLGDTARAATDDILATLCEFSAATIADALHRELPHATGVWACGGGVHNVALMRRLGVRLRGVPLASTAAQGIDPDFVEASAFAWLARETLAGRPGNLASVTGARGPRVLGAIYPA
jgi:anhydro-N-acetylmuramic acid kinase